MPSNTDILRNALRPAGEPPDAAYLAAQRAEDKADRAYEAADKEAEYQTAQKRSEYAFKLLQSQKPGELRDVIEDQARTQYEADYLRKLLARIAVCVHRTTAEAQHELSEHDAYIVGDLTALVSRCVYADAEDVVERVTAEDVLREAKQDDGSREDDRD